MGRRKGRAGSAECGTGGNEVSEEQKPWAYVAFKGDKFGGVCSPEASKESLSEFLVDMAAAGYSIKTVFSRAEYDAEWSKLK